MKFNPTFLVIADMLYVLVLRIITVYLLVKVKQVLSLLLSVLLLKEEDEEEGGDILLIQGRNSLVNDWCRKVSEILLFAMIITVIKGSFWNKRQSALAMGKNTTYA